MASNAENVSIWWRHRVKKYTSLTHTHTHKHTFKHRHRAIWYISFEIYKNDIFKLNHHRGCGNFLDKICTGVCAAPPTVPYAARHATPPAAPHNAAPTGGIHCSLCRSSYCSSTCSSCCNSHCFSWRSCCCLSHCSSSCLSSCSSCYPSSTGLPRRPHSHSYIHHHSSWYRHQMETFFRITSLFARNSPVTGGFPAQCPVTRSFDVFSDLCLN